MVEIPTAYGRLRELEESDISTMVELCSDSDVIRFFFGNCVTIGSLSDGWNNRLALNKIARLHKSREEYHLVIEEGEIKGSLDLNVIYDSFTNPPFPEVAPSFIELAYFVGKKFRRQGVMTRALTSFIPYLFNELNAEYISAKCLEDNLSSRQLLEKFGFEDLGELVKFSKIIHYKLRQPTLIKN